MPNKDTEFSIIRERVNRLEGISKNKQNWKTQAEEIINKIKSKQGEVRPMLYYELGKYIYGTPIYIENNKLYMPGSHDFFYILSLCVRKDIKDDVLIEFYYNRWLSFAEKFIKNKGMILPRIVPCISYKNKTTQIYNRILIDPSISKSKRYDYIKITEKFQLKEQDIKTIRIKFPNKSEKELQKMMNKHINNCKYIIRIQEKLKGKGDIYV